jgi:hypothetical protein
MAINKFRTITTDRAARSMCMSICDYIKRTSNTGGMGFIQGRGRVNRSEAARDLGLEIASKVLSARPIKTEEEEKEA